MVTTDAVKMEKVEENEYGEVWVTPTTLRQILDAGIEVEGGFGHDDAEKAYLMDASDILRVVYRIYVGDDFSIKEVYDVECYEGRLLQAPSWTSCVKRPKNNCDYHNSQIDLYRLICKASTDAHEITTKIYKKWETFVDEWERENEE